MSIVFTAVASEGEVSVNCSTNSRKEEKKSYSAPQTKTSNRENYFLSVFSKSVSTHAYSDMDSVTLHHPESDVLVIKLLTLH